MTKEYIGSQEAFEIRTIGTNITISKCYAKVIEAINNREGLAMASARVSGYNMHNDNIVLSDSIGGKMGSLGVSASQAGESLRDLINTLDNLIINDRKIKTIEKEDKKLNNKFFTTKKDERNDCNHKKSCAKAKAKRKKGKT